MTDHTEQTQVALCPHCHEPHHFTEVRFPGGINDEGNWVVRCHRCETEFLISITNPDESHARFLVEQRIDADEPIPDLPFAAERVVHDLPYGSFKPVFDLSGAPLYVCTTTGESLEQAAHDALRNNVQGIAGAYRNAENFLMGSSAFGGEHAVVHVGVPCTCDVKHVATFYTRLTWGSVDPALEGYLLADISHTDLADRLEGLFSKSDIMTFLSKLLVRWHLTCDQIIVASPFVGHQFSKDDEQRNQWSRLLAQIDPQRAALITRSATLTAFKNLSDGDVTYDLLRRYGLENKLVSANLKKQDFHAKFYVGLAAEQCEVLSGSANLVQGPSLENIVFRMMNMERCQSRYVRPMRVALPAASGRNRQFVLIEENQAGEWTSRESSGWPLTVAVAGSNKSA